MTLSKIIGGILLIGAGCGSASAQRTAVADTAPAGPGVTVHGSTSIGRGEVLMDGPFRHSRYKAPHWRDKDWRWDRYHRFRGFVPVWGFGGGYVYTEPTRDMFGYFGAGGDVRTVGDAAVYGYDRGYPYDWYEGPPPEAAAVEPGPAPTYRCETTTVPDGSTGKRVPVRVCRR